MAKDRIKISAGKYKGKFIQAPDIENFRSVQDVAKQAIFSILEETTVDGSTCLDLFSGSGILGIEALSRNAKYVDFVDEHYNSIESIRNTLNMLEIAQDQALTHKLKAVKFVKKAIKGKKQYDLVFCDPFYDDLHQKHLFKLVPQVLTKQGKFVFLHEPQNSKYYEEIATLAGVNIQTHRKFNNEAFFVFSIN